MGYLFAFVAGNMAGVAIMCLMSVAKKADEEMERRK